MKITFKTSLLGESTGPTGICVPNEVIDQLGGGKKPAVSVTVNGYHFRTTVGVMAGKCMIPLSSEHRKLSGLSAGDELEVELALDLEPRLIEVPQHLLEALTKAEKLPVFEKLAPSKRKEHCRQVAEAKSEETRLRRIAKVVDSL